MPVCGYSKRVVDPEFGLHEMREISFDLPFSELRTIAEFLIDCADKAEAGEWTSNHLHLNGDYLPEWEGCDVIVIHQFPTKPIFLVCDE